MTNLMIRPMNGLARDIDRMFRDFWGAPTVHWEESENDFSPRVNIVDGKDQISLTFELPGMERKDIKVLVKDGMLSVSGERTFRNEQKDDTCIRTEIRSGKFYRSFSLPETVRTDNIVADYKNGLLEISLPKLEEVKPKEIEIKVS